MRTTRRTTGTRLWRWRRNPLRRRSDRVEAWIILVTWLFAVLAGVFAGWTAAAAVDHGLAARRASAHRVPAVLTEDAGTAPQAVPEYSDGTVWAHVRWSTADGSTHTALARVEPGLKTGAQVAVWTDGTGALVSRPATEEQGRLEVSLIGTLVGLGAAGGVLACGRLPRARLDRQRIQAWDREWEQVGPRWRRTTG